MTILNEPRHEVYAKLLKSNQVGKVVSVRKGAGTNGVYAFFDGKKCIYVGRTNRNSLKTRMTQHCRPQDNQAVLAFKLARKALNKDRAYRGENTRKNLMESKEFQTEFLKQIEYVKSLNVHFVQIDSADEQYLFEYYAAKKFNSTNNSFGTH